jgi:predicted nuclease of predicted toxin-antitoxin system
MTKPVVCEPKLLLDESVSPRLAAELSASGVDVIHVRALGISRAPDGAVFERAKIERRALVTVNVGGSSQLLWNGTGHGGVIFLEESDLRSSEQLQVIKDAMPIIRAELEAGRSTENRILRMWSRALRQWAGRMQFEEMPTSE